MDAIESVKIAFNTLTTNKLRSSLTMLGMIIGNASTIALVGIGQGVQRLAAEQFGSLGPNVLFVAPGNPESQNRPVLPPKTLVLADAAALAQQVPSLKGVAPELNSSERVLYRDKNTSALVVGTTPTYLPVRSFDVAKGRFITNLDLKRNQRIVALGPEVAKKLFGPVNPIGQQVRIKNVSFIVVGVMQVKGSFLGNNQDERVFLPITTMADQVVGRTSPYGLELSLISVAAKNANRIRAAEFQITNLLRLRHKITNENDFTIQTQKDILKIVGTITEGLTLLLAAIAEISLLVGGIGIMNVMLMSVTVRTQEIGLRKALGATQRDILIQFMIEALMISTMGSLVGTLIGSGGILLIATLTSLKASVSVIAVVATVSVSGAIGLFFGVVPARQAAHLDPIVALRST